MVAEAAEAVVVSPVLYGLALVCMGALYYDEKHLPLDSLGKYPRFDAVVNLHLIGLRSTWSTKGQTYSIRLIVEYCTARPDGGRGHICLCFA